MAGPDLGADADQQGSPERPGADAIDLCLRRLAVARCRHEAVAERQAGLAADQHEAPRAQPAMVGRTQPGIEDQVEVGTLGRRIFERIAGLAGEKRVERVRGGVHRMRML